ncbi:MAG: sugar-binding domain-containing protein [Chitinophagia bacterium]
MKKLSALLLIFMLIKGSSQKWQPAGNKIATPWAEKVNASLPLPEYPRPQMVRNSWQNLNGLWDYTIQPKGNSIPNEYNGKILVPYCIESSLSGVQKIVGETNELWYHRTFIIPYNWRDKKILLHFGAVDWKTEVWVNEIKIGTHEGGFTPFNWDISPFLHKDSLQEIIVKVWDPTDQGFQPRGKQVSNPRGIWYTSVTGIWQTVWLEPVSESHISSLQTTPNIDRNQVSVRTNISGAQRQDWIEVSVIKDGKIVGMGKAVPGEEANVPVPNAQLWWPENPFLYDLEISLIRNGKIIDQVKSYVGMRKISTKADSNGIMRLQLNNKNYFQFGPLDQGWWPDGLYTAPTDEALLFDILQTKKLGFNMIRKHVKVEPARWYYHCDKEGMLVWQDMPSGDANPVWQMRNYFNGLELKRTKQSEDNFMREWKDIIDLTYSNPCVVVRVPFNEAWGQFKTPEVVEWTKMYDPSRLVNPASGGNHYAVGDMLDMHNYPDPVLGIFDNRRANVLGEYGGIGLVKEDHLWENNRNWGYVQYKTSEEATSAYLQLAEKLKKLIPFGYAAAVYTQTTDVETEINGLMTYDRKVMKLNADSLQKINREIIQIIK